MSDVNWVAAWEVLDNLPERLRETRHKRGMTLRGVATATGVSASSLSVFERGERTVEFPAALDILAWVLRDWCDTCKATGTIPWLPGQHRNSDADEQPCPDCQPAEVVDNPSLLTYEERVSLGCRCKRIGAQWHHERFCPVPAAEVVVARALGTGWTEGAVAATNDYGIGEVTNPYLCHCGEPVVFGYDGNPAHTRGMCARCDERRCDAFPGTCEIEEV